MHILVTNDDGPPSPHSSPYVHSLIRHLQAAGHIVSVCLPHIQRSWIGKAHMIGQTVKPLYYRPSSAPPTSSESLTEGTTHRRPSPTDNQEEWVLVDGTPASCVQIGLYHFFKERGPVDLVVSGPNYGRNTTAVFALSSGTLGGALEAAVCRNRAIALSYAFFTRNHDPDIILAASRHSVRVIEALERQWPADGSVDVYSVNVPLLEGMDSSKVYFAEMLQNYWSEGGCFQEIEGSESGDEEDREEERIREGDGGEVNGDMVKRVISKGNAEESGDVKGHTHKHFKWAPRFTDVYKSVEEAPPGNDGWAVKEGFTSITPLKANFAQAAPELHLKELELPCPKDTAVYPEEEIGFIGPSITGTSTLDLKSSSNTLEKRLYALIAYGDSYVQPLISAAFHSVFPDVSFEFLTLPAETIESSSEISLGNLLPPDAEKVLQITPYESLDFEYMMRYPERVLINSYMIRKALIRKHYLSTTVETWIAKSQSSLLKEHVKRSEAFEVDYAEFLEDALVEAFDLRASLEMNNGGPMVDCVGSIEAQSATGGEKQPSEREWWILKPGMSDRGQGIRLFSTMRELQGIFDEWEADQPDSEADNEVECEQIEGNAEGHESEETKGTRDYITASHLRHFVAQPYIHPPLLLHGDSRKFHIRTYVLCVGSLKVYVYRDMLALFAGKPYIPPWNSTDLEAHLTNTCLQPSTEDGTVRRFWDIELPDRLKSHIFEQILHVTGEVFEAAARGMMMHFQPLPNAFEVFGVDFLVDARGTAWLLEINAFPDFKQTGDELRDLVAKLWEGVLRLAVRPFLTGDTASDAPTSETMIHVRSVDLGSRFGGGKS